MTVNEASVKYFRENLAEVIDRVSVGKEIFTVTKYGKGKVYVIPADLIDQSHALKKTSKKNTKTVDWASKNRSFLNVINKIAKKAKTKNLPSDLAINLDKYLYHDGKEY